MGDIKRFEDIEAWQKARELMKSVYVVTSRNNFSKDYGLTNQIRRASISVMSNISEGFERDGDREFLQFLAQAKGSCGEVRSHLYAALDLGYLKESEFEEISNQALRTSQIISGLMRYLRKSEFKGSKFK